MPPRGPGGPLGLRPRPGSSDTPDEISQGTRRRIGQGFVWGMVAAGVMTVITLAGLRTGLLPLPEAVPIALVDAVVPVELPGFATALIAWSAHLLYGGFWGSVLSVARARIRAIHGLILGVALWAVMLVLIAPMAGWGMLGREAGQLVWAATLVPHLAYGLVVGLLLQRFGPNQSSARVVIDGLDQAGGS